MRDPENEVDDVDEGSPLVDGFQGEIGSFKQRRGRRQRERHVQV